MKLTTYLQLVLRSRMRGFIHPLPPYVFMAWYLVLVLEFFAVEREIGCAGAHS
jgi:hypothetical protein